MYRSILVPLDGSPFGEQALPHALNIARRAGAALEVVHVYSPLDIYTEESTGVGALREQARQQRRAYLEGMVQRLTNDGKVPATSRLLVGDAADVLCEHAQTRKFDLVVMMTHGRGPLSRFWLGSVADSLMRRLTMPVLLIRPQEAAPAAEPVLSRMQIPLDGSPRSEQVLTPAVALAALMQASIDLLRVVDPPLNLNPVGEGHGTVLFSHTLYEEEAALRQRAQAEAERYLKEVAQRLRAQDLRVETRVAADLSPAAAILGDAADHGIDVIAMAPHGRGALARLFIGSVADKVVRAATVPVLVIRSPDSRVSPSAKESSMNAPSSAAGSSRLVLAADTAADLMAPNPISISAKSSVKEASLLLTEKGFSAAPVIDDAGRPVGVISKTDIVVHAREKADYLAQAPEYYQKSDLTTAAGEPLGGGFQVESVDATLVRDIMTPAVFSVVPETPAGGVVQQILELKVHRLFVVDRAGVLVGVISALDILRCLR